MLTARGDDVDRIVGLELGADDYLSKPFNPRELVARIRAILRRIADRGDTARRAPTSDWAWTTWPWIEVGVTVRRAGAPVELTAVEFSCSRCCCAGPGPSCGATSWRAARSAAALMPFDRSLDVHVSRLRKKLGPRADGGERIPTLRAVGYMYT